VDGRGGGPGRHNNYLKNRTSYWTRDGGKGDGEGEEAGECGGTFGGARPVLGKRGGGGKRLVSDLARWVVSLSSSTVASGGSLFQAEGAELVRSVLS
jgi:hypothetical protein